MLANNNTAPGTKDPAKAIHVFPPPESKLRAKQLQELQAKQQGQQNERRRSSNSLSSSNAAASAAAAHSASYSSLQVMIDAARDGDCIYIQPGRHELTEPLYVSSKKKLFIIGFVESHTETEPPTLRMKVTAPSTKKSVFAHLLSRRGLPLRPMIRVQEGAEVFMSHMRFEYDVEYQDDIVDPDLQHARGENDDDDDGDDARDATAGNGDNNNDGDEEEDDGTAKKKRKKKPASGKKPLELIDEDDEESLIAREQYLRRNHHLAESSVSAADEFVPEHDDDDATATNLSAVSNIVPDDANSINNNNMSGTAASLTLSPVTASGRTSNTKNKNNTKHHSDQSQLQQALAIVQKEKEERKQQRQPLPVKACALEISGAATQVTLNACTFISGAHGIVFRCTATSVGAQHSFTATPRLSLRDGCVLECPAGTCIVAAAQDSGYAVHSRTDPMSPPRDSVRPPEGVLHVAKSVFCRSEAAIELSGPLHVKITDCDFDSCQIALAAATCMQTQLAVSETLFVKCGIGAMIEAPSGAGSSRDVTFDDSRFDQCERGLVQQGPDACAHVDGCVFTRCTSCAVCIDGGRASFANSIFQQNDVGAEIIDGKPTFANNTFHANTAAGVLVSGPGTTPTIRENTFTNTGEGGAVSTRSRLNAGAYLASGTEDRAGASSLNAHRRSVRCAAVFVEGDATPLVEYNRFENNYGANVLVVSALGVFTDNALGAPSTDSYNVVVSGLRACPRIQFNVLTGNDKGQARPTVVIEDGASADVQLNDFTQGRSSAVVLRRSGQQTIVSQNRIQRFLEAIVVMEHSRGVASRNNMGSLNVEIFSDSKETFESL